MEKRERYEEIRRIMEQAGGLRLHEKAGSVFHFPVYLTGKMEQTGIEELELSARAYNCLRRADIRTVGDLCLWIGGNEDLKKIRNCGKRSVAEIMEKLFLFQYASLRPDKQEEFLAKVVEMNRKPV